MTGSLESKILNEIMSMVVIGSKPDRRSSRLFFKQKKLNALLRKYCAQEAISISKAAQLFGMSTPSLNRILNGDDVSENMVFRLQRYFEDENISPVRMPPFNRLQTIVEWKLTNASSTQIAIGHVSLALTALLTTLTESNQIGSENSPINELQKAQLIALLETMLNSLKAPAIKPKESKKLFNWLGRLGKKGVEKGLEKNVSKKIDQVVNAADGLFKELADHPNISDLTELLK